MMWNARFFCHDTPLVRRHRAGDQGGRLHPDRGIARKRLGDTRAGAVRRAPAGPQARAAPGTAPPAATGKQIVLLIDLSGEGCVVDAEGRPLLGLTSISSGFSRELGEPG